MRLGILGGTFDPVHIGHLLLAETCFDDCRLDRIMFVPCSQSPHKRDQPLTAAAIRLEMLQLAIGGNERFEVSEIEILRGGISYTVDTLEAIRSDHTDAELFFLLGADSLSQFHLWHRPDRICELATLLIARRTSPPQTRGKTVRRQQIGGEDESIGLSQAAIAGRLPNRVMEFDSPLIEISSSEIRQRVAQGRSIRYRTPRAVEVYIHQQGLYRDCRPSG